MIQEKTWRMLLDDTGYTAAKITDEDMYIKKEFKGCMTTYAMLSGRSVGKVNRRTKCERLVIEYNGRIIQVDVKAEIHLGE